MRHHVLEIGFREFACTLSQAYRIPAQHADALQRVVDQPAENEIRTAVGTWD